VGYLGKAWQALSGGGCEKNWNNWAGFRLLKKSARILKMAVGNEKGTGGG
jgi:hypothetical protein